MALLLKIDQHLNRIVHLFLILYKMRTLFFFFFPGIQNYEKLLRR